MTEPSAAGTEGRQQGASVTPRASGFGLQRFLLTWIGLFVVWMLLVASFEPLEILVGALVAALVAVLSAGRLAFLDDLRLTPLLPLHLARYFTLFFKQLILANLDVATRVVAPSVDITPEIVEVRTGLQSELGKLWLANSITLTPGTLTIDVEGDLLKVHWIDVTPGTDIETATREIAEEFEAALREFLK